MRQTKMSVYKRNNMYKVLNHATEIAKLCRLHIHNRGKSAGLHFNDER